ncbi:GH43 family beta-xylosidase [Nocardia tenerifensis]|uniref:GH43 family beta-xylosidase n=1 Tax=Nocardia tenerifensis TaxID=228006 RepID=A0A318L0X2_9NOCA|nr:glycoside hydrolase family 43 protein [Nocardia tenerifensis]PXX71754.1 GH43 family beta-xylosidase [Nocardia tenerifensis]
MIEHATADCAGDAGTFRNPLHPQPDPFLTFYEGNYYLSTSQSTDQCGCLRMRQASSLADLAAAEPITVWLDDDPSRNQDMWAPSFHLIDGQWYFYYTAGDGSNSGHRLYVLRSEGPDPLGPYEFAGLLGAPDVWAIDPELLQLGDRLYLLWSGPNNLLHIAPMSDPVTVCGRAVYLPSAGGCPEVREAPATIQRDGTTYLVYSTCDTGKPDYQLWMHSLPPGADPLVPANWRQHPNVLFTRNDAAGVFGPGSNGFFQSPDGTEDWIVYHAKETDEYTYEERTTRAQRFTWCADGTPDFGEPLSLDTDIALPSGDPGSETSRQADRV